MSGKSLTKNVLKGFLMVGAITIAASSPYFALQLPKILSHSLEKKGALKGKRKEWENTFNYLKRNGYLNIEKQGKQIYISLTDKGKKRAGKYQINDLEIVKPKKWDGIWRIVIFDIPNLTQIKREALRGKLKELGFYMFQRSVWIYPYECRAEINLLREFFGLEPNQLSLIEGKIEADNFIREIFSL